ncbi:MAG: drug/metabolite transporter (DMT)-like permease [Psychromonas sp.]|jgi:drug/metabolite transporter (DMT)-like permease|uniref:DMT family transporter n=1 Tax=Psychromonas sp. TaxID=1884585 RepID=UPI0039E67A9B
MEINVFKQRTFWLAFLGLVATNLFWAINATLARGYMDEVAPIAINLFRWLGAFVLLTPFALRGTIKNWHVIRPKLLPLTGLAVLSITLYNSLLYLSANFTTAVNITLINTLIPVATLLIAWRVLGNRPRLLQLIGITVSIIGVLLILTQGQLLRLLTLSLGQGDLLMLAAVICWSLFTVLLKKMSMKLSPIILLYVLIMLGLPFLIFAYGIEALFFRFYWPSLSHLGLLAYLWVFPSIFAYIFWTNGVQKMGAETASLSITLMPLFGAVLAITFLGESICWFHIVGGICSLLGMILALVSPESLTRKFHRKAASKRCIAKVSCVKD